MAEPAAEGGPSLRHRALHGGAFMALRQLLGMILALIAMLTVSRIVGPTQYGLAAAAAALITFIQGVSQVGVGVYLIRREGEDEAAYHQAWTLMVVLGAAGVGLALCALPFVATWTRIDDLAPVACVLAPTILVAQLGLVPLARLERAMRYRAIAGAELGAQVLQVVVSMSAAIAGAGAWALVAAWWAQQVFLAISVHVLARHRPRLAWDAEAVRQMLGFGLGYSASLWIWQLRSLVNPLVVGRYAGAEAVGWVSLAVRLVEVLAIAKNTGWRISMVVLTKLRDEPWRLAPALAQGVTLQILVVGPVLAVFLAMAPVVVPAVFGPGWEPVVALLPWLALGILANASFNLHSAALYVMGRNGAVALFHAAHILIFAGAAALLVPREGVMGFAHAEVLALPSYLVIHAWVAHAVGPVHYGPALPWLLASVVAIAGAAWSPWAVLALLLPLTRGSARRELLALWRTLVPTDKSAPGRHWEGG